MAEPEDPQRRMDAEHPLDDFDDDLVGFASPRALSARPSPPLVPPEPEPAAGPPDLTAAGELEPESTALVSPMSEPEPESARGAESTDAPETTTGTEPQSEVSAVRAPEAEPTPEAAVPATSEPAAEPVPAGVPEPTQDPAPAPVAAAQPGPQPDPTAPVEPSVEVAVAVASAAVAASAATVPSEADEPDDDVFEAVRGHSVPGSGALQPPVMEDRLNPSIPMREAKMETSDPGEPARGSALAAAPEVPDLPEVEILSPRPEAAPAPPPDALGTPYGQPGATRSFERRPSRRDPGITSEGDARLSLAIYACLIATAVSVGLTAILALFLSWTGRLLVKGWTRSHLLYQLRTSLIGVVAGIVGVVTFPLGLGVFVLSATVIWVVVRGAAGLVKLLRHEEIRDPKTWKLP
ncbi:MAG: hypothetical protein J0L52_11070 [Caulobacterales bacterium]|nr:hypothetical protein [Caulobacterales bacterium]